MATAVTYILQEIMFSRDFLKSKSILNWLN